MGGQRQTAHEDVRPGFVKRPENFDETRALARAWRWNGETVWQVEKAVLWGTPGLSPGARHLLQMYLGCLFDEDLQKGDATVFPGSRLLELHSGCVDRTLRRHRRELEAAGLAIHQFNQANRPLAKEGVDLAPLVARLAELEAVSGAVRDQRAAEREAWLAPAVEIEGDVRPPGQICPPKQSQLKGDSYAVRARQGAPEAAEAETLCAEGLERPSADDGQFPAVVTGPSRAREAGDGHRAAPSGGSRGSPRRASGPSGSRPAAPVPAGRVLQELALALEASPRLKAMVPARLAADPFSAQNVDIGELSRAATQLLPERERNSGMTLLWGWERHGPRVIAMLACAIEDPRVENPCRYFGSFVSSAGPKVDLTLNLKRIIRFHQGKAPGAAPPGPFADQEVKDHPVWAAISGELRARIREGAWGSWFSQVEFVGFEDQVLMLTVKTGLAVQRIKDDFGQEIRAAARAAGHPVLKVMITRRKGSGDG